MAAKKRSTRKAGTSGARKKASPGRKKAATKKTSARRYSKGAARKVGRAMHEMKRGKLRSGRSKKKVASRKQAIAIGLNQARRRGEKVPRTKGN